MIAPTTSSSTSTPIDKIVRTRVELESLTSADEHRQGWQTLIDTTLLQWLRDPSQLSDDGIEPPSETIIRLAIDLAEMYRDHGVWPPNRVVPDPNGGIVFELHVNDIRHAIHIWDDGIVEYQRFVGTRLDIRREL